MKNIMLRDFGVANGGALRLPSASVALADMISNEADEVLLRSWRRGARRGPSWLLAAASQDGDAVWL